jgi:hypothetical protein
VGHDGLRRKDMWFYQYTVTTNVTSNSTNPTSQTIGPAPAVPAMDAEAAIAEVERILAETATPEAPPPDEDNSPEPENDTVQEPETPDSDGGDAEPKP